MSGLNIRHKKLHCPFSIDLLVYERILCCHESRPECWYKLCKKSISTFSKVVEGIFKVCQSQFENLHNTE